jgi:putative multiple sugar transport system permease protein
VTQTGILAIGMTLVILIGGIDLSVGSVLAVSAVVLALFSNPANIAQVVGDEGLRGFLAPLAGPWSALLLALLAGAAIGAINGGMISRFRLIPFIVTLAMLTMARGLAYLISGSQSLTVKSDLFRVVGVYSIDRLGFEWWHRLTGVPEAAVATMTANGVAPAEHAAHYVENLFQPDVFASGLPNPAKLIPGTGVTPVFTIGVMAVCFLVWLGLALRARRHHAFLGYETEPRAAFTTRAIMVGVGFSVLTALFASHQGLPVMVLVFAALALGASFLLDRTVFGRHLYAIGSNRLSAHLAGVKVPRCTFIVFLLMGLLAAISGIVATSRAGAATPATQGLFAELESIAAVIVGGTSLMGGVGTIGGTVFGVLIIGIFVNAMILMALPNPVQLIFKGLLIVIAVMIDRRARGAAER